MGGRELAQAQLARTHAAPTHLCCHCGHACIYSSRAPAGKWCRGFCLAPSSSALEVGRMIVIMCNFNWSFHCTGIFKQSVPASNACGISQVPLSASKECCMGGRVVSLYSHWTTRRNRINCSCKALDKRRGEKSFHRVVVRQWYILKGKMC